MSEPIVMLASIPPIMTALKVDGSGGARLQLDIPDSETEAIKALLDMRGAELVVTVQRREMQGATEQPTVRRWNERRH
jgi:cysteine synthase